MKAVYRLLMLGFLCQLALGHVYEHNPSYCKDPPDPGPCDGGIDGYYYNSTTRRCEEFFNGGCKGNQNFFFTAADCINTCSDLIET
ncbi:hypothetical protein BsWGS_23833 [Bradybaena similaris]